MIFYCRLSLLCVFLLGITTTQTNASSSQFDFEILVPPAQLEKEDVEQGFSGDALSNDWFLIHGFDWSARFSARSGQYERVGDRERRPWRPEFFSLKGGGLIAIGFARRPCSWRNPLCFLEIKYFNPQIGVRIYEHSGEVSPLRLSNFHRDARLVDVHPRRDGRAFWALSLTDDWDTSGTLHMMSPGAVLIDSADLEMNLPGAIIPHEAGRVSIFGAQVQPQLGTWPYSLHREKETGTEYRIQQAVWDGDKIETGTAVAIGTPLEFGWDAKAYPQGDRVVVVGARYGDKGVHYRAPIETLTLNVLSRSGGQLIETIKLPDHIAKCWEQGVWSGGALWVVCGDPYNVEDVAADERTFENGYGSVEGWRYEPDTGRVQPFKFRAPRECDKDWSFPAPVRTTEIIPRQGGVVLYSHAIYCAFVSQVSFEGG